MCVAIYKPANVKTPSLSTLSLCWESNPHGAGFAIRKKNADKYFIEIHKGFMTWEDFAQAYEKYNLADFNDEMLLHFRITTHGGTCKGNCHPFPITDEKHLLKMENVWTNYAVVHNGILPITPSESDISDTMEFTKQMFVDKKYRDIDGFFAKIAGQIGSNKIAVMTPKRVKLLGDWKEIDGVFYSNTHWDYIPYNYPISESIGYGSFKLTDSEIKEMNDMICPYCHEELTVFFEDKEAICETCGFGATKLKFNSDYEILKGIGTFYY